MRKPFLRPATPLPLTSSQTAWLAGIIEGEGCFTLDGGKPCVEVAMSDLDIIERVGHLIAAPVYAIPQSPATKALGRRQMYRVRVRDTSAVAVMLQVMPYLGERRTARATELILDWLPSRMSHLARTPHISSSTTDNDSSRRAA